MKKIITFIIDLIFPPTEEELLLRSLSPDDFLKTARGAPPSPIPNVVSIFAYKDPLVRELVWQIKYKKNKHATSIAAFALYKKLKGISQPFLLIPIPISRKRRKERGYNQCELLIDEIIKLDTENKFEKDFSLLIRSKHIERQTLKGRNERFENTQGIFEVTKKNKMLTLVIIDDVITTGSTAQEAYKTLLSAGYSSLLFFTIAH